MTRRRFGIFCIALSYLLYAPVFLVPFTSLDAQVKIVFATTLAIAAYTIFAIGCAAVGREAVLRCRDWIVNKGRLGRAAGVLKKGIRR